MAASSSLQSITSVTNVDSDRFTQVVDTEEKPLERREKVLPEIIPASGEIIISPSMIIFKVNNLNDRYFLRIKFHNS